MLLVTIMLAYYFSIFSKFNQIILNNQLKETWNYTKLVFILNLKKPLLQEIVFFREYKFDFKAIS